MHRYKRPNIERSAYVIAKEGLHRDETLPQLTTSEWQFVNELIIRYYEQFHTPQDPEEFWRYLKIETIRRSSCEDLQFFIPRADSIKAGVIFTIQHFTRGRSRRNWMKGVYQ